jgi:hypothetical protein
VAIIVGIGVGEVVLENSFGATIDHIPTIIINPTTITPDITI